MVSLDQPLRTYVLQIPLSKEKAAVMSELLESVQTAKLQNAYEKYLPAVLNSKVSAPTSAPKQMIAESRVEVTGDKAAKVAAEQDDNVVIELKRLAGLK